MTDEVHCGVCGFERPRAKCHIIVPTEAEQAAFRAAGQEPLAEYIYCSPCWRTLRNPVSGPALIQGLVHMRLRQAGVADAEALSAKFHHQLVSRIKPRS